ncbi:interferon gamma receptor 2 [Ochotona princeps]|uniref:interferon gamma receptor 2 n=1 Tax=Ochotona princeps TaxID=9978 RepID=UPI0027146DEC|nr:interferon gamma receptor 2 [Ochotona princeps]
MRPPLRPWLLLLLLLLLLLGGYQGAAPEPDSVYQLSAPQNPKIQLYNAEQVLSWEPAPLSNGTRPVVYRVQYKYTTGRWNDVAGNHVEVTCTQIAATQCDFTAAGSAKGFQRHYNVTLRLRAELGELHSAWVTTPWFQHYRNVTVGPPRDVWVTPGEGSLVVMCSPPFNIDSFMVTFDYHVHYWEKAGTQQVRGPFKSSPILLTDLKPLRMYCLQVEARLVWTAQNIVRPGHFSNISCSETIADASTRYQQILLISLGVFSFLLVLAGACYFLVLKYRGHAKYWFHSPPSIPQHIEEYLKDPAQPILEALDKEDSSPRDDCDTWDNVLIVALPEKETELLPTP